MIKKQLKKTIISFSIAGVLLTSAGTAYAALGDQVLTKGMTHDDVLILQQELKNLGFFTNEETTTYYGDVTEKAVMDFQKSEGLEITGEFDNVTFEAIKKFRKSPLVYERLLKVGLRGKDIKELQEALKHLGYLDIEDCTEYFGYITEDAVMAFQEAHGLAVDGSVGQRTIDAINNVLLGRVPNNTPNRSGSRTDIGSNIARTARKFLGARYVSGGNGPNAFDCSGFTTYVYGQFGIKLPRTSTGQASVGTQVSKDNLQVGDLLIFSNTYKSGPSHAGIYLGNGQFIHASTSSTGVIISDLNSSYYRKHFSYGRRVY